jgi:hypothetical protein
VSVALWHGPVEVLAVASVPARRAAPRPGDVVVVGRAASVQFAGVAGFNFRVIRVDEKSTYQGWCWLDGYQLDGGGDAVERRSIFVQLAGLRPATPKAPRARG